MRTCGYSDTGPSVTGADSRGATSWAPAEAGTINNTIKTVATAPKWRRTDVCRSLLDITQLRPLSPTLRGHYMTLNDFKSTCASGTPPEGARYYLSAGNQPAKSGGGK